jgi:hypothetical protein
MALYYQSVGSPCGDFLPKDHELEEYLTKIRKADEDLGINSFKPKYDPNKKARCNSPDEEIRKYLDFDEYDMYGRNISEQQNRQEKVPWIKVRYVKGKLYIPDNKKNEIKKLNLN